MNVEEPRQEPDTATVEWVLIAAIGLSGVVSLVLGSILWGSFVILVAVVAALPAIATRDRTATVPWPLLALELLAALARIAGFYSEAAGYFAIIGLALIVVIELQAFSPVELSRRFAIVFSVMTTMALEAVWIIGQSASDRLLATELLRSQNELQWDIVLVTVLATVVGVLYYGYAWRFDQTGSITVPTDDEGRR